MPQTEVQNLISSLDTFHEVRLVNSLIQGLCARSEANEFGSAEVRGLMVVLEWQNEKIKGAEAGINMVLKKKAALFKAA